MTQNNNQHQQHIATAGVSKPNGAGHRVEQERAQRRRREDVTVGRQRNLAVETDLDPAYEYRWINDYPGRVYNLTVRDDWDVVTGDDRGDKDKSLGTSFQRIVGKTDGLKAILVRKPKDYYEADRAKAQERIDDTMNAMKRGATKGGLSSADNAYVPDGGISFKDGRRG